MNLTYEISRDGSLSIACQNRPLLSRGFPGIDGEALRVLQTKRAVDGKSVEWKTADGIIRMCVIDTQNGSLQLQYELKNYKKPIHIFWPIQRGYSELASGFYQAAGAMGETTGYFDLEDLEKVGVVTGRGLSCLQYKDIECSLAVYVGKQDQYETIYLAETRTLMNQVPLSFRADGADKFEKGLEFSVGIKIENTNGEKEILQTLTFVAKERMEDCLESAAEDIGKQMGARLSMPPAYHWCSWYYCYCNYDMKQLIEYLNGFEQLNPKVPMKYIQLDVGYCPSIGDWLLPNERYPEGLRPAFEAIIKAGYLPGIWVGAFMVGNRSCLYAEHPDWILYDLNDKPVVGWITDNEPKPWGYQDEEYYILDTSHPDAMAYMKSVFKTLYRWGARLFKTDFMLWGLQDSTKVKRHTPGKTSVEYFREFLQEIREAIGEESYWLGCIAPFIPFIGYADGMRIGNDVGSSWRGEFGPQNMLQSLTGNNYANHHYYQIDPDAVMLRDFQIRLKPQEIESLALLAGVSGACIYTSDPLHKIASERVDLFRYLEPDRRRKASLPFLEQKREEIVYVHQKNEDGKGLLYILNPMDRVLKEEYNLEELGFSKYDFVTNLRNGETHEVCSGYFYESIPAHECRLYLISEGKNPVIDRNRLWKNL